MANLTDDQINEIFETVEIIIVKKDTDIQKYSNFECGIDEYDQFLIEHVKEYSKLNITQTLLLEDKKTKELIGYMSLSNDLIKLSKREKKTSSLDDVCFTSLPALKVGKLAVSTKYARKGYASFLLYIAELKAFEINQNGVACRFLSVDADIEYDKNTEKCYVKNGFIRNKSEIYSKHTKTISMRKDIYQDNEISNAEEKIS